MEELNTVQVISNAGSVGILTFVLYKLFGLYRERGNRLDKKDEKLEKITEQFHEAIGKSNLIQEQLKNSLDNNTKAIELLQRSLEQKR